MVGFVSGTDIALVMWVDMAGSWLTGYDLFR